MERERERERGRLTSLLNRSAGRFIAMRQPNFSRLYFRFAFERAIPSIHPLVRLESLLLGQTLIASERGE